ncbi:NAD-dependent succinate-semialdehyde dehydrogenase [Mangrovimonas sp. ST2L15]|uniref:NAD-dependent succinate-semialdehyde dehydrogenase n=1 Tax=Mangrovimonas sp. ST2L15 TaxID=1645916 RepID=UPI0006B5B914|nr:NAD-dependent succinate-semialdehyde dehydrogenase [Mangrovimonas sp. ST2L15]
METSNITTINPYSGKILQTYNLHTKQNIEHILAKADSTFKVWKETDISKRTKLLKKLAKLLRKNRDSYGLLMTQEVGKPISQSKAEVEKCAWLCDFYAKNADQFLADALIETEAKESFISYDPMGTILAIMPWNFPFWQVMRFAVPTLTAGNTAILKHASNVSGCALLIQNLFEDAGYPEGCFQTVLAKHDAIEQLISDDRIKAISLTGSEGAGRKIAEIAGKNLKKLVLELGGNNACIVLNDANLDTYLDTMVNARMQNSGQSCIAAKRFIVEEKIYDEFLARFLEKVSNLNSGDPEKEKTEVGVLAREDLAEELFKQVEKSVDKGAVVAYGNHRDKAYYQPTVITDVTEDMPIFTEETFGPVAAIMKVKDKDQAYKLASNTRFGLGTMVFTEDIDDAYERIGSIEDGSFFINEMVKSDPRLPFGGTKASGYGRELSIEGIMEFVNKKAVYINK